MATVSTSYSLNMANLAPRDFANLAATGSASTSAEFVRISGVSTYMDLGGTMFSGFSGGLPTSGFVQSFAFGDVYYLPPFLPGEPPPPPLYIPTLVFSGFSVAASAFSAALQANNLGAVMPTMMAGEDVIDGSAVADVLLGYGDDDVLNGGDGNDVLDGGTGSDTLRGGLADDTYVVDDAGDFVSENADEGTDTVQSSITYSLAGKQVEHLTLTGTATINATGNDFNNILIGNGVANTLNGGLGADSMVGGGGNDTYRVDHASDLVIEAAGAGTDSVNTSVSYSLVGIHAERLTLLGTGAINATGNNAANMLAGNAGANILNGGLGADTMAGGLGNDTYRVDNALDKVNEAAGAGTDTVNTSVSFSLAGIHAEKLTLLGTSAINGTGNNSGNIMTGNSGANTLNGGLGNDTLTGGAGADNFVFNSTLNGTTNVDKINGFSVADDTIQLADTVFTALSAATGLTAAGFRTGAAAADSDDRIIYDSATGKLYYDADGTGAAAQVLFAQVNAGLMMTHADFTVLG